MNSEITQEKKEGLNAMEKKLRMAGQKLDALWMEARTATGQARIAIHKLIGTLREKQGVDRKEHDAMKEENMKLKTKIGLVVIGLLSVAPTVARSIKAEETQRTEATDQEMSDRKQMGQQDAQMEKMGRKLEKQGARQQNKGRKLTRKGENAAEKGRLDQEKATKLNDKVRRLRDDATKQDEKGNTDKAARLRSEANDLEARATELNETGRNAEQAGTERAGRGKEMTEKAGHTESQGSMQRNDGK